MLGCLVYIGVFFLVNSGRFPVQMQKEGNLQSRSCGNERLRPRTLFCLASLPHTEHWNWYSSLDCRMEWNMHRQGVLKRSSMKSSCCNGSLFYISAKQVCMGKNKQKAWFNAQTPWLEELSQAHWCHIYHINVCRKTKSGCRPMERNRL